MLSMMAGYAVLFCFSLLSGLGGGGGVFVEGLGFRV